SVHSGPLEHHERAEVLLAVAAAAGGRLRSGGRAGDLLSVHDRRWRDRGKPGSGQRGAGAAERSSVSLRRRADDGRGRRWEVRMMRSRKHALGIGMVMAGCWLLAASELHAADESRYATITITGKL